MQEAQGSAVPHEPVQRQAGGLAGAEHNAGPGFDAGIRTSSLVLQGQVLPPAPHSEANVAQAQMCYEGPSEGLLLLEKHFTFKGSNS